MINKYNISLKECIYRSLRVVSVIAVCNFVVLVPIIYFLKSKNPSVEGLFSVYKTILFDYNGTIKMVAIIIVCYIGQVIYLYTYSRSALYARRQQEYEKWKEQKEKAKKAQKADEVDSSTKLP